MYIFFKIEKKSSRVGFVTPKSVDFTSIIVFCNSL